MTQICEIIDLECAHCAAKMEAAIAKLPGVTSASISFMTQQLVLEAAEDEMPRILQEAAKICKKIEPDCQLVAEDLA